MKILFFNAGYCTGIKGTAFEYVTQFWKYLYSGRKVLRDLRNFLREVDPDVVALAEVDSGSARGRFINQVEFLGRELKYGTHMIKRKYDRRRIIHTLPILRNQSNAILAKDGRIGFTSYYMRSGVKRLIIQAQIQPDIDFFVVHLSLGKKVRVQQLRQLSRMITHSKKVIVAGDFNVFTGHDELTSFMKKHGLVSANRKHLPTFPSWRPVAELDYFLVSPNIKVKKFKILNHALSDHLPIMIEI
ncbi:endonuclease [Patescibacteria group bacterium]|nr:MAG: endonuclease [Patescibacteria group bacterium]